MRVEHIAQEPGEMVGQYRGALVELLEQDMDVALVDAEVRRQA